MRQSVISSLRIAGLWLGPDDIWLTRAGDSVDEPGLERMAPTLGYHLAQAWASDPEQIARVEAFLLALEIDVARSYVTSGDRASPILEAILGERIWCWERRGISVDAPSVFPSWTPGVRPNPRPDTKVTWIEIVLVDEKGRPVPNERYRLVLPDGSTRAGQLDENGFQRVDGIEAGICDVTFPDIDGREWSKKGS